MCTTFLSQFHTTELFSYVSVVLRLLKLIKRTFLVQTSGSTNVVLLVLYLDNVFQY